MCAAHGTTIGQHPLEILACPADGSRLRPTDADAHHFDCLSDAVLEHVRQYSLFGQVEQYFDPYQWQCLIDVACGASCRLSMPACWPCRSATRSRILAPNFFSYIASAVQRVAGAGDTTWQHDSFSCGGWTRSRVPAGSSDRGRRDAEECCGLHGPSCAVLSSCPQCSCQFLLSSHFAAVCCDGARECRARECSIHSFLCPWFANLSHLRVLSRGRSTEENRAHVRPVVAWSGSRPQLYRVIRRTAGHFCEPLDVSPAARERLVDELSARQPLP